MNKSINDFFLMTFIDFNDVCWLADWVFLLVVGGGGARLVVWLLVVVGSVWCGGLVELFGGGWLVRLVGLLLFAFC